MASCVKEGLFFVGEDPQLGHIRGLDPWAVDNGIHLIRMEPDTQFVPPIKCFAGFGHIEADIVFSGGGFQRNPIGIRVHGIIIHAASGGQQEGGRAFTYPQGG